VNKFENTVVTLTPPEILRMEMIVVDKDKDEALSFLKEVHRKINEDTIKGMKNPI
jgi:hypothetical protein